MRPRERRWITFPHKTNRSVDAWTFSRVISARYTRPTACLTARMSHHQTASLVFIVITLAATACSSSPASQEEGVSTAAFSSCDTGSFDRCIDGGGGGGCAKYCPGSCRSAVESCARGGGGKGCADRCGANSAPAEACVGAVLATAAWCRTPITCAATLAAVCGACVEHGCVVAALDAMACDPDRVTISAPYPDGSCCQVCANGLTDICDPGLCQ